MDHFDTTQQFADTIKHFVLAQPPSKRRKVALSSVQALERCGWHSQAMLDAVNSYDSSLNIYLNADGHPAYDVTNEDFDWLDAVPAIVEHYRTLTACAEPSIMDDIFDATEAAQYLGISRDMFYTYSSRQGRINGTKKGGAMLYTRQQLDAFKKTMLKPGERRN